MRQSHNPDRADFLIGEANQDIAVEKINDPISEMDLEAWTVEEIDLLSSEIADLLAGDGFDESDD